MQRNKERRNVYKHQQVSLLGKQNSSQKILPKTQNKANAKAENSLNPDRNSSDPLRSHPSLLRHQGRCKHYS